MAEIKNSPSLQSFFKDLKQQYRARLLLLDPDDKVLLGDADESKLIPVKELSFYKNFYYTHIRSGSLDVLYMHIPILFSGNSAGKLIFFFDKTNIEITRSIENFITRLFFYYLIGIGIGVIILLVPSSILITQPLQALCRSAQRIAKGDFAYRANIEQKDEIGDLADAFNKMAYTIEQMIKSTKQLTTNISRELKPPMDKIQFTKEAIKEKLDNLYPDDPFEEVEEIEIEIKLMNRLIDQILLLSKLDGEGIVKEKQILDITKLIKETASRFIVPAKIKSIELGTWMLPNSASINGNTDDIRIAISNLLDNAVKYTPVKGKIKISLSTVSDQFKLTIANTCDFIPDENLEKLFKPFYRPGNQHGSGTGLGLAITKKIIENHSGTLEVYRGDDEMFFQMCFKPA